MLSLRDPLSQAKVRSTIHRLQHLELVQLIAFDGFHIVPEHLFGPADELARVASIREDLLDRVEAAEQAHQHGAGRDPVLDAGRMDDGSQQVAFRVYRDVALAALDLLARVVTAPPLLAPSSQFANR